MKKVILGAVLAGVFASANAAIILQEDATLGQVGTLPATLTGSFDSGTDVQVVTLATMSPTVPTDHAGGDGAVLRIGDLGAGGGSFNWAYITTPGAQTDVAISADVYIEFATRDATPVERDYFLLARTPSADPQASSPTRIGYWLVVGADSSWTGITPNPVSRKPFLMKRNADSTYTLIGSYGAADVTDGWHRLKLEIIGSEIKGYVDGVVVCSGNDSTYASGTGAAWGFYDDNGSAAVPTPYPYAAAVDNLLYETASISAANSWSLYQ